MDVQSAPHPEIRAGTGLARLREANAKCLRQTLNRTAAGSTVDARRNESVSIRRDSRIPLSTASTASPPNGVRFRRLLALSYFVSDEITLAATHSVIPTPCDATVACNVVDNHRRGHRRHLAAYRPACILVRGRMYFGVMRNVSTGGAMIEVEADLAMGERVTYFWDETNCIEATVAWREGRRFGLENGKDVKLFEQAWPHRSVRVPCETRAEAWLAGRRQEIEVFNLSLGGMRVRGLDVLVGTMLTIRICRREFAAASVRWIRDGEAGIRFAHRLTPASVAALLLDDAFRLEATRSG